MRHRRFLLVVAAAVAVSGCTADTPPYRDAVGLPLNRPVTRADLHSHPEARLWFPGSRLVRAIGADQTSQQNGEEDDPAYAGAILTAHTTPARLYAWYAAQVAGRGYRGVIYYRQSDQPSGMAWQAPTGREQVQVAVYDPGQLAEQSHIRPRLPPGDLIYEELFVDYPERPR